ncbi:hypothetical protein [Streptomyces violascens]|uniref:Uncharacterized protein n=1 Tax=Streptomyces violascens TaxID=67381 RepID=A0ABQ3R264_9ACTN|nr:hypothetical protein [Streptomyces violascens]GGU32230.1 hypothetical protein GCM10010289_61830 [Streptomyces violascens]GHI43608.1 hypothetical protein Sviol_80160 [Streptomyces violascens]
MTQLAMPALGHWNTTYLTIASLVLACAGALDSLRLRRRTRRNSDDQQPATPSVKVAALAAVVCTAYSADTSWRFATDYLDMVGTTERAAMFAAAELALFATALLARQNLNLNGPKQAPGLPGLLTWVITAVQVIPAYAESGPVGGTVRAFVGPVMAAVLWHQAMGIELRLRKPEAASHSMLATASREIRERLLSRLGIAERDRDAAQITRDRATRKAVALAAHLAERTPKQRSGWRGRHTARRLSQAIAQASVGSDHRQRQVLLHQLAARRHATALATIELPSPWTDSISAWDSASSIAPLLPPRQSGASGAPDNEQAKEHPDPDHQLGVLPSPSVQSQLPLHEMAPAPKGTVPVSEEDGTTARYGRPPGAEMAELLAIGRKAIEAHGKNTRAVLRNAIRDEAGLTIAEDRLTELKALLTAEQGAETSARTD